MVWILKRSLDTSVSCPPRVFIVNNNDHEIARPRSISHTTRFCKKVCCWFPQTLTFFLYRIYCIVFNERPLTRHEPTPILTWACYSLGRAEQVSRGLRWWVWTTSALPNPLLHYCGTLSMALSLSTVPLRLLLGYGWGRGEIPLCTVCCVCCVTTTMGLSQWGLHFNTLNVENLILCFQTPMH